MIASGARGPRLRGPADRTLRRVAAAVGDRHLDLRALELQRVAQRELHQLEVPVPDPQLVKSVADGRQRPGERQGELLAALHPLEQNHRQLPGRRSERRAVNPAGLPDDRLLVRG